MKNKPQAKALKRFTEVLGIPSSIIDKIYRSTQNSGELIVSNLASIYLDSEHCNTLMYPCAPFCLVDMDVGSDVISKKEYLNQCDVRI
jgi:hypothetical protein